jgi:hypothetical protein
MGLPQPEERLEEPTIESSASEEVKERTTGSGGVWNRFKALFYRQFVEPLSKSTRPPWYDARGVAVGLFVGFGIPVGAQCLSMIISRIAMRYNLLAAFAFSFITNPFSFVPMYYGYYYLGSLILGRGNILTKKEFLKTIKPVMKADHFVETLGAIAYLGQDLLLRWFVAAMVFAIPATIIGYYLTIRWQRDRCVRRARKMGIAYNKLLEDLEERLKLEERSERNMFNRN